MSRDRHQVTDHDVDVAAQLVMAALCDRIDEKGRGIFVSSHEVQGALVEEVDEFKGEVRNNDSKKQKDELLDVAVAALWGIVSLQSGKMDW